MFPSACSLRSTQCAALIALATAAGISRFEETPTTNAADEARSSVQEQTATRTLVFRSSYFQIALRALAPWLRFFDAASDRSTSSDTAASSHAVDTNAEIPARINIPALLPSLTPHVFASVSGRSLSARQHSFPFAVGPPACVAPSTPRAESISVLSDSASRRILPVRIAPLSLAICSSVARLARPDFAGAHVARPLSRICGILALRGEIAATVPKFERIHPRPAAVSYSIPGNATALRSVFFPFA